MGLKGIIQSEVRLRLHSIISIVIIVFLLIVIAAMTFQRAQTDTIRVRKSQDHESNHNHSRQHSDEWSGHHHSNHHERKSTRTHLEHQHRDSGSPRRREDFHRNDDQKGYLPVTTVCHPATITPSFSCGTTGVDIDLVISGAISPIKIRWNDGTTGSHYSNANYNDKIDVVVVDARDCATEKTIYTPVNVDSARCNGP